MPVSRLRRRSVSTVWLFVAIEFFDELVFGIRESAWPLIRDDLELSYTQVGLLLAIPNLSSAVLEPLIGIAGDTPRRRPLMIGGGIAYGAVLGAAGMATGFPMLLAAMLALYPASGAFVSLAQASMIDTEPERAESVMARWTLAGSLGVVAGPIALGAVVALGGGWRDALIACAGVGLVLATGVARVRSAGIVSSGRGAGEAARGAASALRRPDVWRWLGLTKLADLMLDVLFGFLALYMVDVSGANQSIAGLAIVIWATVGLAGDALMVPAVERLAPLRYLRWSAVGMLALYPAFLLAEPLALKLVLLALVGLANAGWYAILQAQLYRALPGQSGAVMALSSGFGSLFDLAPLAIGAFAAAYGLDNAMWLLLLGPAALVVAVPRHGVPRGTWS